MSEYYFLVLIPLASLCKVLYEMHTMNSINKREEQWRRMIEGVERCTGDCLYNTNQEIESLDRNMRGGRDGLPDLDDNQYPYLVLDACDDPWKHFKPVSG
jgi:hypothetical protein